MRQTWHIFLKDARRLRYDIILIGALTAVYVWLQGHVWTFDTLQIGKLKGAAGIMRVFVLPMACGYLASRAVYGEPIPGDRQFWVTRPYRWTSLLGAELLFMIAFVSFPLMLADCFILTLKGFLPGENPAGLLWHPLAVFAVFLLPMIAVASITASFERAVLVGLVTIVPIVVMGRSLGPYLDTMSESGVKTTGPLYLWYALVLLSAALAIMILQYRARRTGVARIIFVCAAALLVLGGARLMPGDTTWALQTYLSRSRIDTSSISVVFPPGSGPPTVSPGWDGTAHLSLPVRVTGVPSGTTAEVDVMIGELTLPNGKPVKGSLWFLPTLPGTDSDVAVWRSFFGPLKGTPMRLHLTVYLTVHGNANTVSAPFGGGPYRVPGVGLCEFFPAGYGDGLLCCWAPFRLPAYVLPQFDKFDNCGPYGNCAWGDDSTFPPNSGIDPIAEAVWNVPKGAKTVAFTTMQTLAHMRRELDIPNVQVAESAP